MEKVNLNFIFFLIFGSRKSYLTVGWFEIAWAVETSPGETTVALKFKIPIATANSLAALNKVVTELAVITQISLIKDPPPTWFNVLTRRIEQAYGNCLSWAANPPIILGSLSSI